MVHSALFFSRSPLSLNRQRCEWDEKKRERKRWFSGIKTFFCRNLIANFRRFKCIRSPCSNIGPDKLVGSWFSITSSSFEVRVWSNNAVAKSWHCRLNSWYSLWNLHKQSIFYSALVKTRCFSFPSVRYFFFVRYQFDYDYYGLGVAVTLPWIHALKSLNVAVPMRVRKRSILDPLTIAILNLDWPKPDMHLFESVNVEANHRGVKLRSHRNHICKLNNNNNKNIKTTHKYQFPPDKNRSNNVPHNFSTPKNRWCSCHNVPVWFMLIVVFR